MKKNILIAYRKHMISEGLSMRLNLEPDITVVGWAKEVNQFESLYAEHKPDSILICSQFQGLRTPKYICDFASLNESAKFLVVSDSVERHLIVEFMESGARGFVSPAHGELDEMMAALRSVSNGGTYVCQKATENLLGGLFNRNQSIENEILSEREKQVVRLVSDGQSSKEIGRILDISPSTVEVHRRNIMRKIGAHKTADITRYAIRSQLVTA